MLLTPRPSRLFRITHARGAVTDISCTDAGCDKKANGWLVILANPGQKDMIDFIRSGGTKRHYLERVDDPNMITFVFAPGQDCFNKHQHKDPLFLVRRKDSGGQVLTYQDGDHFIEDSDKHLRELKTIIEG